MYRINELFYSLQGEGFWSGRPAVFIRFSGCNLKCPFCDTDHTAHVLMSVEDIVNEVKKYPTDFIVLTGGEPALYVDEDIINALHKCGKYISIETNGTHPVLESIDWITLSPKDSFVANAKVVIDSCNEIKIVYDGNNEDVILAYSDFPANYYYVQPCDMGEQSASRKIMAMAIEFCLKHPLWSLSLQQHKIVGIQ